MNQLPFVIQFHSDFQVYLISAFIERPILEELQNTFSSPSSLKKIFIARIGFTENSAIC